MGGFLGGYNFFIYLFSIYCSDHQREGFLKRFHQSLGGLKFRIREILKI
jgi:hypothetical protein